jgi:hypothetical protein
MKKPIPAAGKALLFNEISALSFNPKVLISLWDMIPFVAAKFHDDLLMLDGEIERHIEDSPESDVFTPPQKGRMIDVLQVLQLHCREYQLDKTFARCAELRRELQWIARMSYTDFDIEAQEPKKQLIFKSCDAIKLLLIEELSARKFAFIPATKEAFFEKDDLFGPDVAGKFKTAKQDIREAGNCLAADLNTAAIFHLMRVVELGLRALAKKLHVEIGKVPVEYMTWETVIDNIESKIRAFKQMPKGKKKADTLEFYHGLMGQFNFFKDVWRNHVMHSRKSYDEHRAMSAFVHVREFMQRLAEKVREVR